MGGLLIVGLILEPVLGRKKYLLIYLLTGVLGSLMSIWWNDDMISLGVSGAIFGLYGVFLSLLLLKFFPTDFSKVFLIGTLLFIGFNLLVGLSPGIDNTVHIGGLLSGFISGLFLSLTLTRPLEKNKRQR